MDLCIKVRCISFCSCYTVARCPLDSQDQQSQEPSSPNQGNQGEPLTYLNQFDFLKKNLNFLKNKLSLAWILELNLFGMLIDL